MTSRIIEQNKKCRMNPMNFILPIMICITLTGFVLVGGCTDTPKIPPMVITENMISLDRGTSTSGSFVWGSGIVKGEPAYIYRVSTPNGGYKLKSIVASKCTEYYTDNVTPHIVATYLPDNPWLSDPKRHNVGEIGDTYIVRRTDETPPYSYSWFTLKGDVEIYVPTNSIKQEYNP